jgi:hypothetical protein
MVKCPKRFFFSSKRFLLVILQLHSVLHLKDGRMIQIRLDNLPTTPTEAYRDLLDRMTDDDRDFVRRILGWVFRARRILKMAELQEVLALDEDSPALDLDDCVDAETLEMMCGGLIVHDRDRDLVTFSHETVRPFLETQECMSIPSHSVISMTCLAYFRLPPFENPHPPKEPRKEFKFGYYAADFWAVHAVQDAERDVRLELAILETLRSDGRRHAMEQLKNPVWYGPGYEHVGYEKSLLHVLIQNSLSFIFTSPESTDERVQTYVLSCLLG